MKSDTVQTSIPKKTCKEMINAIYGINYDEIAYAKCKLFFDIGSCCDNHVYFDTDSVRGGANI